MYFRDGRLKVGDEIINVCGRRLRGLSVEDAIQTLKQKSSKDLDIVISRDVTVSPNTQTNSSTRTAAVTSAGKNSSSSTPSHQTKEKHSRYGHCLITYSFRLRVQLHRPRNGFYWSFCIYKTRYVLMLDTALISEKSLKIFLINSLDT